MLTTLVLAALALQKEAPWSEPVAGLRGRLSFAVGKPKNGIPKLVPYLELKNVTDVIGTVDVYLDPMKKNLALRLVDDKGKDIEDKSTGLNGRNGFVPNPMWLLIPFDSTVKMNVGLEGYFNPANGSLVIETDSALLYLPRGFKKAAYVTGTFSVNETPSEARSMRWEGVIELPKVLVFSRGKIVASESKS